MKHVLVTAGTVYGKLDDNKLVGNRIRGIWASKFACWLAQRGYSITLLLPDTFDKASLEKTMLESPPIVIVPGAPPPTFDVRYHTGYESYAEQCYALAPKVDAAVMAAAVVNWIPKEPFKGKMPTEGFSEGAEQLIPFILAPRVIDRMKKLNPNLTLIGCKMTSGAEPFETLRAAYASLIKARCNVVVANDLARLQFKALVYPDGNTVGMGSFARLYDDLEAVIRDQHWRTEAETRSLPDIDLRPARTNFDALCNKYRARFVTRPDGERVFGALAVRIDANRVLVSPREKGAMFSSEDAVVVTGVDLERKVIFTLKGKKATLNAPLLFRVMLAFDARAVVHLHELDKRWQVLPYGPPGTVRDNDRPFSAPHFNIEGHGCVFVVC